MTTSRTMPLNKSLHRALEILSCFSEETPEWGVSELSRHLNISKSSVSTILTTLAQEDLVQQLPMSRRYHLGLGCLSLGFLSSTRIRLRDIAYPYLESLLQDNRIIYLAIPYKNEVMYIEALYPSKRNINHSALGRRAPMHCTGIGKAMLAFMSSETIDIFAASPLQSFTANTITDKKALVNELKRTKEQGYATDIQEREEGIQCVAAPIRSNDGTVIAGLSVSGSSSEISKDKFPDIAHEVIEVSRDISRKIALLGYNIIDSITLL
ncbi:MAG: IclR family transcriptional regulator [Deinococcota bacterium]